MHLPQLPAQAVDMIERYYKALSNDVIIIDEQWD